MSIKIFITDIRPRVMVVDEGHTTDTYVGHFKGEILGAGARAQDKSSKSLEMEKEMEIPFGDFYNRDVSIVVFFPNISDENRDPQPRMLLYGNAFDKLHEIDPDMRLRVCVNIQLKMLGRLCRDKVVLSESVKQVAGLMTEDALKELKAEHPYPRIEKRVIYEVRGLPKINMDADERLKLAFNDFSVIASVKDESEDKIGIGEISAKILEEEIMPDFAIKSADETVFKCHKSFLAVQSPVFQRMFENQNFEETQANLVTISEMSNEGIQAFLEYIYTTKIQKAEGDSVIALELLEAAHKYQIQSLEKAMKKLFRAWPKSWGYKIDVAIHLFLFARNVSGYEDLKLASMEILKKFGKEELLASPDFKELFGNVDAAMELSAVALDSGRTSNSKCACFSEASWPKENQQPQPSLVHFLNSMTGYNNDEDLADLF